MKCQKCGSMNSDKAKVCHRCLTSLTEGVNAAERRKIDIFYWLKSKEKKEKKAEKK